MGVESRWYTVLSCDRCGATLGEDAVYAGTVAARLAAAELGWRLVPKRLPDGTEVAVPPLTRPNIRFVNDVCPDCAAKFTRRRAKITWSKEARGAAHAAAPRDEFVGSIGVAQILGPRNQNSVSVYRKRYDDFPKPIVDAGPKRDLVWRRSEVEMWDERHPRRRHGS